MRDQVCKYGRRLPCTYVGEVRDDEGILQGKYKVVYVSPESILRDSKWRNMLRTPAYKENVIALAVDEAHCIYTW